MAPLPTFALEPRRHIKKQLEVLNSSLVSNTADVNVDLEARHEMLLDVKPGESDGRKPSHCFKCLNHLRHHLHPLLLLLGDWSPSSGRRPAAGPASARSMVMLVRNQWNLHPLRHQHLHLLQHLFLLWRVMGKV